MYNKTNYNKTTYNRFAQGLASMYATIKSEYGLTVPPVRMLVDIGNTNIVSESSFVIGRMGLLVPIGLVVCAQEYGAAARLSAMVRLGITTLLCEYNLTATSLRTLEGDELSLDGINLAPGEMLIIDTDTLEITVDGEIDVDSWVTGSTFFQLSHGSNELRFYDNASDRELSVTAIWADRYL